MSSCSTSPSAITVVACDRICMMRIESASTIISNEREYR
ncbi:Uncharacterised protein [Bordetella pertussis]|nr:Uncharacterised protein [Bordetella pertussis]CFP65784.1 Uncharacterised protein [Bordetella pertussis]